MTVRSRNDGGPLQFVCDTFADLATIINPRIGEFALILDDGSLYYHTGTSWETSTAASDPPDLSLYQLLSEKSEASGYASLDVTAVVPDVELPTPPSVGAHDASAIAFTPVGTIAATDVQAAIAEVASEAGSSGAPTTLDYLVGTASGSLSAEIVVGTTPNGELGGTWDAITVDATHAGSAHHAAITIGADNEHSLATQVLSGADGSTSQKGHLTIGSTAPADIAGTAAAGAASTEATSKNHVHKGVASVAKAGSTALVGAVTLTGGTNVTLTQSGNDISIAAAGGTSLSIDKWMV